jgi:hypothetical protein
MLSKLEGSLGCLLKQVDPCLRARPCSTMQNTRQRKAYWAHRLCLLLKDTVKPDMLVRCSAHLNSVMLAARSQSAGEVAAL